MDIRDLQGRLVLPGDKVAFASSGRLLIGKFSHVTPTGMFAVITKAWHRKEVPLYTRWGVVRID